MSNYKFPNKSNLTKITNTLSINIVFSHVGVHGKDTTVMMTDLENLDVKCEWMKKELTELM